jgi:hypothetical protein
MLPLAEPIQFHQLLLSRVKMRLTSSVGSGPKGIAAATALARRGPETSSRKMSTLTGSTGTLRSREELTTYSRMQARNAATETFGTLIAVRAHGRAPAQHPPRRGEHTPEPGRGYHPRAES